MTSACFYPIYGVYKNKEEEQMKIEENIKKGEILNPNLDCSSATSVIVHNLRGG